MYSLKLAHLIKEKLPEAEVSEYFIDMRCYGKGYEEFYNRISSEGIQLVRGKIASIKEGEKGLLIRAEDIQSDTLIEKQVDMVVLSVGLELSQESKELAEKLNITVGEDGWLKELDDIYSSTETNRGGIFVVGTCQGPKDIPDTVIQASSVASRIISSIITKTAQKGFNELKPAEVLKTVKELST